MIRHVFLQALLALTLFTAFIPGAAALEGVSRPVQPEAATGTAGAVKTAAGARIMVVTSNPEATRAGYDILARGGSAADAAVAVQTMLGLTEPQSSGIGGGGFALYYDAASKQIFSFDGRETAPETAGKYLFRGEDGKPMEFYEAAVGGRAVGVPGMVALLHVLHTRFGALPWRDLFVPAIQSAEAGFTVSPRLAALIDLDYERLLEFSATRLYFMPDSVTPVAAGDLLRNPPYASTLRKIAMDGPDAFYKGEIGADIVRVVREYYKNRGMMTTEDMAGYKAIERKSVCGTYRAHMICTVPEPASGGLTVLSALGVLEQFNLAAMGPESVQAWHLIAEASRLAFADRNQYMADPRFVLSPGERLIDKGYLQTRAALIDVTKPMPKVEAGVPQGWEAPAAAEPQSVKPPGTAHFAIVDSRGNILSMTSSIEDAFGSRLYVDGFMLNNQLTDFSFVSEAGGKAVANRVEGGKRPRSSMAPMIVFYPDGTPYLVIGSAGGSAIPGYVLQRIVALIDWKMSLPDALSAANILHRGGPSLEMDFTASKVLEDGVRAIGHPVERVDLTSGIAAIEFKNGQMTGAADPRREGTAQGE